MFYFRCFLVFAMLAGVSVTSAAEQKKESALRAALKDLSAKSTTFEQQRLATVGYIALGEYAQAYFTLKKVPPAKRDPFIRALLYEIYSKLDMLPEAAAELQHIAAVAQTGKKLTIPKALFCRKIMGFGMYNPFASTRFAPSQLVLVYSEVDNFTRVKAGATWEIDLTVGILIRTELGDPLYRNDAFSAVHFSPKSPTRDLWLTSRLHIPKTVRAGKKYILLITVTDAASGSVATKSIPFIGAVE